MEKASGGRWERIVQPRDEELEGVVDSVAGLLANGFEYEGSAPLTIDKILRLLRARGAG